MLVDASVFSERCKIVVVENAWDNALRDDSVTLISNYCGCKHMESFAIKDLQSSQANQIMVGLGEAGVVFRGCKISEG